MVQHESVGAVCFSLMWYGVVGVTAAGGRTNRAVPRNVSRVKIIFCFFLLVFANESLFYQSSAVHALGV